MLTTTESPQTDDPTTQPDTPATSVTVTAEAQLAPLVAAAARTISGRVLPWDEFGRTTNGALKFAAGAINIPTETHRVKLLAGHMPTGTPIGHATSWECKADGLYMTFQLGSSPAADASLLAAAEHVIDAFSVEAYGIERKGTTVTKSIMSAVALVPMPAFASARVDTINAAAPSPSPGPDPDSDDEDEGKDQDEDTDADTGTDTNTDTDTDKETDMSKSTLTPGVIPGTTTPATPEVSASMGYYDVLDTLGSSVRGEATAPLLAELVDITDASTQGRNAPAWLGELWSGVSYERRIIPKLTTAPLTASKAVGYRWKKRPGVDQWAGNKTDIPSFPAEIETVEMESKAWAGGNDIDRRFRDFGETQFLDQYWRAMAEDYAFKTDRYAGGFVVDNATKLGGTADSIIHAVARGAISIDLNLHTTPSFVIINPNDLERILTLTNLDAPKYLDMFPAANPANWTTSEFVDAGSVIVGTKNAATFFELPGSPLRSEAEHIAKGGFDRAIFGYAACLLNRPEGLVKVAFDTGNTPAPTPNKGE